MFQNALSVFFFLEKSADQSVWSYVPQMWETRVTPSSPTRITSSYPSDRDSALSGPIAFEDVNYTISSQVAIPSALLVTVIRFNLNSMISVIQYVQSSSLTLVRQLYYTDQLLHYSVHSTRSLGAGGARC